MNPPIPGSVNAYEFYNKMAGATDLDDPNAANIDYRVTGRLKFFNEG